MTLSKQHGSYSPRVKPHLVLLLKTTSAQRPLLYKDYIVIGSKDRQGHFMVITFYKDHMVIFDKLQTCISRLIEEVIVISHILVHTSLKSSTIIA